MKNTATISRNRAYGVSSKYEFGAWNYVVYGPFTCEEDAQKWLHTEEYDFRDRALMSKTAAVKLAGKKAVENAVDYELEEDFYKQEAKYFGYDKN